MVIFNSYVKLPEGMISVDPQISFRHRPCTLGFDIDQCHQPKFLELDLPPWGFRMFAVTRALSLEGEQSFLDNMCMIVYVYIYIRLLCVYIYIYIHMQTCIIYIYIIYYIYVCVCVHTHVYYIQWYIQILWYYCANMVNFRRTLRHSRVYTMRGGIHCWTLKPRLLNWQDERRMKAGQLWHHGHIS